MTKFPVCPIATQLREDKLKEALKFLGQRHLLAKPIQRLDTPRSY